MSIRKVVINHMSPPRDNDPKIVMEIEANSTRAALEQAQAEANELGYSGTIRIER